MKAYRTVSALGAAALFTLVATGCTQPPPNAVPLPSTSVSLPEPTDEPTSPVTPEPSTPSTEQPSPTAPATPSPTATRPSKPTPVPVGVLVRSDIYPGDLRDLPPLTPGAAVYDGPDGYPPYADNNDLYVIVKLPKGQDPVAYVDEYVASAVAQGWEIFQSARDDEKGTNIYKLVRDVWVMDVRGATLKNGGVVILSATIG